MTAPVSFPVTDTHAGARFHVRVSPRSSRTALTGVLGDALKIALNAPPVEGRANVALIEFLADLLELPRSHIEISAGAGSRNKTILVRGRDAQEVHAAIQQSLARPR